MPVWLLVILTLHASQLTVLTATSQVTHLTPSRLTFFSLISHFFSCGQVRDNAAKVVAKRNKGAPVDDAGASTAGQNQPQKWSDYTVSLP